MAVLAETVDAPDVRRYPHRRPCPAVGAPPPEWSSSVLATARKAPTQQIRVKPVWKNYCIVLKDEMPRIGSGYRPVEAKVGYKWVRVRSRLGGPATRIRRAVWDTIVSETSRHILKNTDPEYVKRRTS